MDIEDNRCLGGSSAKIFVKENLGKITDNYMIGHCVGRTEFGEVRKCLHKLSKAIRQVKILNVKYMNQKQRDHIVNEINMLFSIDHPNIEKIYEFYRDSKKIYIVTDFYKGLQLFDKIVEEEFFSEEDAAKIVK